MRRWTQGGSATGCSMPMRGSRSQIARPESSRPTTARIPFDLASHASKLGVAPGSFPAVVQGLVEDGRVVERNGTLAQPGHRVELNADRGAAAQLVELLGRQPLAPPSLTEALKETGAGTEVVRALSQRGDIVRVGDDVAFTRDAYEAAVAMVREIIADSGSITVAQLRDRMGASRRPVLALLEHLDSARVTRRVGDARVLR